AGVLAFGAGCAGIGACDPGGGPGGGAAHAGAALAHASARAASSRARRRSAQAGKLVFKAQLERTLAEGVEDDALVEVRAAVVAELEDGGVEQAEADAPVVAVAQEQAGVAAGVAGTDGQVAPVGAEPRARGLGVDLDAELAELGADLRQV